MSKVGQRERKTQDRIVAYLKNELGFTYLGNLEKQSNQNLLKDEYLAFQKSAGVDDLLAEKSFSDVEKLANSRADSLYQRNKNVYQVLRYGIKIAPELGQPHKTIWPINWENIEANRFAFAEEVTVDGTIAKKRPDIVIYINGIAVAIIELKRSTVSIDEGIIQHLDNQKEEFIEGFFSTIQLLIAGNDTQGVKYGTVGTELNGYYSWNVEDANITNKLDRALNQLLSKERLIKMLHSYIAFTSGKKLIARSNQFHGVDALVKSVENNESGIIWHTQGSGKSMTMVWGARMIRENIDNARILILTDREQLDEQIEGNFFGVGEKIKRAKSGTDLVSLLSNPAETLICSLIHKFGKRVDDEEELSDEDVEKYVAEIKSANANKVITDSFVIFIDEAHRTQAGALHKYMKELLPNAIIIGFTGTPIFKNQKTLSLKIFGRVIHSYKYDEAVRDGVVTDIAYEARDVDKVISDQAKIDAYFDVKTKNLNDNAKTELKRKWASKQEVDSARERLQIIVDDINLDMLTKPRLMTDTGNAILVASSIEEACIYYDKFEASELQGKVGLVTSYKPNANDLKGVGNSANKYNTYTKMISKRLRCTELEAVNRTDDYNSAVKELFLKEPAQMKLLIVVDMLLTGFDAPTATYLYIDKQMKDHGLFQAVCRVNRIDPNGPDKTKGYVVDYRGLFGVLKNSILDYTKGGFENYDPDDLGNFLKPVGPENKTELDDMVSAIHRLLEPISDIDSTEKVLEHFIGDTSDLGSISTYERLRTEFYKQVNSTVRTYSALSGRESEAGYTEEEFLKVKENIEHFVSIKEEISVASGDYIDIKLYEKDMRTLIDTYIKSNKSRVLADLSDRPLLELLASEGEKVIADLPKGISESPIAVAETITNNIRRTIVEQSPTNPKYFEKMSSLLEAVLKEDLQETKEYEAFLKKLLALSKQVVDPVHEYPIEISHLGKGAGALYDQINDIKLSVAIDEILMNAQEGWRSNPIKTRQLRNNLMDVIGDEAKVDSIIDVAKHYENY